MTDPIAPESDLGPWTTFNSFIEDERLKKLLSTWFIASRVGTKVKSRWNAYQARKRWSVSVPGTDALYPDVHSWLLTRIPSDQQRALRASSRGSMQSAAFDELVSEDDVPEQRRVALFFDSSRAQTVTINGHAIEVAMERPDWMNAHDMLMAEEWAKKHESIVFTAQSEPGIRAVIDLLNKMAETQSRRDPDCLISTTWGEWRSISDVPPRDLETVVLKGNQKEVLVDDLQHFLSQEMSYAALGIPWHRGYLFHGPAGTGKGVPLDTPVLTPSGWVEIGTLNPGDSLIGRTGNSIKVIKTFDRGIQNVYKITLTNKATVVCDEDHLWTVQSAKMRRTTGNWYVKSTKELLLERLVDSSKGNRKDQPRWFLPLPEPIQHDKVELPIEPYLLGVLLANGSLSSSLVSFTTNDSEIAQEVFNRNLNIVFRENTYENSTARRWTLAKFHPILKQLGLDGLLSAQKFIPSIYLVAHEDARRSLLAGLMDCDGSGRHTRKPSYFTVSIQLANGVMALVRSLGGEAKLFADSRDPINYEVKISLPQTPFLLPRKQRDDRWNGTIQRGILSIEPCGQQPTRCITTDAEDGLFVMDNYIVTHNTSIAKAIAHRFRMDVYFLALPILKSDGELIGLLSRLKPRSMLVIEDIDIAHSSRQRSDSEPGVTASGLLNALDGFITPHGLVTIMTTNKVEVLDPALVRPGRVDLSIEIGNLDHDQLERLMNVFCGPNGHQKLPQIKTEITPAQIIEIIKQNMDEPEHARKAVHEFLLNPSKVRI